MAVYLRSPGRDRVLLDTAKAHLDYEGTAYDLTSGTLDFYDAGWEVVDGTQGEEAVAVKVFKVTDPFTGLGVEIPIPLDVAEKIADALCPPKRQKRRRRGR